MSTLGFAPGEYAEGEDPDIAASSVIRAWGADIQAPSAEIVTVIELTLAPVSAPEATVTRYYATLGFATGAAETPADTEFAPRIVRATIEREAVSAVSVPGGLGGLMRTVGEVALANQGNELAELVEDFYAVGRQAVIKVGTVPYTAVGRQKVRPYAEFTTSLSGTIDEIERVGDEIRLTIRDRADALSRVPATTRYLGTGELEGTAELKDVSRPLALGLCLNASPQLLEPAYQIWHASVGPVAAIPAVYDSGIALGLGRDWPTRALLAANPVMDGDYDTCLAEGLFRLARAPLGRVTCDVNGVLVLDDVPATVTWSDGTGFSDGTAWLEGSTIVPTDSTSRAVRYLAQAAGIPISQINISALRRHQNTNAEQIGLYVEAGADEHTLDLLARLAASGTSLVGMDRNGLMTLKRINSPEAASQHAATASTMDELTLERLPPPYGAAWPKRVLSYAPNWTVMSASELAGGVTDEQKINFGRPSKVLTATDSAAADAFPTGGEARFETLLATEAAATAEMAALGTLYTVGRELYRITTRRLTSFLDVGSVLKVENATAGLSAKWCIVLRVLEDYVDQSTQIEAYG